MHSASVSGKTLFLLALLAFTGGTALSQNSAPGREVGTGDTTALVVRRIRFSGNNTVGRSFLWRTLRTRPNREFLSVPGFTPWYWLWKQNPKRGEPPSFVIKSVLEKDVSRIKAHYTGIGFFEVEVIPRVTEFRPGKAEVSFEIRENQPSMVRNVIYSGLPDSIRNETSRKFLKKAGIPKKILTDTSMALNRRYSAEFINLEQSRLIQFLRDHGYAAVTRDSVKALVSKVPGNDHLLDVTFNIRVGRVYSFGNVYVDLTSSTHGGTFLPADTLKTENGGAIIIRKGAEATLRNYVVANQIRIPPGGKFDHSRYLETINRFQGIRAMRLKRFNLSEDGSLPDYTTDQIIPAFFEISTIPKYQVGADLFGMQRVGFGAGAGLRFTNNNIFNRAHRLEFGLNGNFEYVSRTNQLLRSIDGTVDYTIPNLSFPFNWLDNNYRFLFSETQFQIGAAQVNQINFNVNANLKFNWRFNVTHTRSRSSSFDFVELDILDASPTSDFLSELDALVTSGRIDELQKNLILNDYQPQANSTIRYTWRDVTTNVVQRNSGHFYEYSAEISGNFPYLSDRFIITPGTIEGYLPSISSSSNDLIYSQFLKFSADHREYISLNDITVLALRAFGGYVYPFGGNEQLPINRRFFAGGSNDIRGWLPLRLGPGSLQDQSAINGGHIKLLFSGELRGMVARDFLASNWILSLFTDAGNVWQNKRTARLPETAFEFDRFYKQIAVGGGYGLRLDWEFVVFRIEMAYRLHDLEQGWFSQTRLIRDGRLQFGIGHAF